jgi:hypothetical protein
MTKLYAGDHGRGGARRGLVTVPVVLAASGMLAASGVLAACGVARAPASTSMADRDRQPAAKSTAAPRHGLCADPAGVGRVVVFRTSNLHDMIRPRRPVPRVLSRASGVRARALAEAVCALPKLPPGPLGCPAQFLSHYVLVFTAGHRRFPAVTVQPTGCQTVSGLGRVRWAARTPSFWAALDRVTHGQLSTTMSH